MNASAHLLTRLTMTVAVLAATLSASFTAKAAEAAEQAVRLVQLQPVVVIGKRVRVIELDRVVVVAKRLAPTPTVVAQRGARAERG